MTVMEKGPAQRPAYADGKTKLMLIDGRWVPAASGKTFESRNPATGELITGGIHVQTQQVLKNREAILTAAGSGWEKVVRTSVYLKNMSEFTQMNEVYGKVFQGTYSPPAYQILSAGSK